MIASKKQRKPDKKVNPENEGVLQEDILLSLNLRD